MKLAWATHNGGSSAIVLLAIGCSTTHHIDGDGVDASVLGPDVGGQSDAGLHRPDAGTGGSGGGAAGASGVGGGAGDSSDAGTAQTRACSPSTGVSCPYVGCDPAWEAFPGTVHVSGRTGSGANGELAESLHWSLTAKPATSSLPSAGPNSTSFDFVPDVAGDYTWCLSGTTASYDIPERCCVYRSVTDFQWSYVGGDRSTRSIEDVEFTSGLVTFSYFEANQPFQTTSVQASASRESLRVRGGGAGEAAAFLALTFSLQYNDNGTISYGGVQAGDTFAVQAGATPLLAGQATTMSATISLSQTTPPTSATAPVITATRANLYAGSGGTVGVRLATTPAPTDSVWVQIGGWQLFGPTGSIAVADDGNNPDATAGDGWFTGRLDEFYVSFIEPCNEDGSSLDSVDGGVCDNPNAGSIFGRVVSEPATYSVLMRAQTTAGNGPYYRASLEWK